MGVQPCEPFRCSQQAVLLLNAVKYHLRSFAGFRSLRKLHMAQRGHLGHGGPGQFAQPEQGPRQPREAEPFRHVISLGCRCSQSSIYKSMGARRYACPFDWIFSSAAVVSHCLKDDFKQFLDRSLYFLNGSSFDAIGLKPGSAPRERKLIGHSTYSSMTAGVGRGTIFNHRDPLHNDSDFQHTQRCVQRFRRVLASADRKLFVVVNLNPQLWIEADVLELYQELAQRTSNFLLLVLDCSNKNLGPGVAQLPAEAVDRNETT